MSICSKDLRRRVINAIKSGATKAETAQRFSVSMSSIFRWQNRINSIKPGPKSARKMDIKLLKEHISSHPDAFLSERAECLNMSVSGIWRAMRRLNIHKKNVALRGRWCIQKAGVPKITRTLYSSWIFACLFRRKWLRNRPCSALWIRS